MGTGAGFPGIPLKIAFPNLQVTLFDSLNKRIKFLQEVIDALNLNEISAVHGRAEEGARDKAMREKYDFVVSRAVANMAVLSEYCIPFVKAGGYFIPYKTGTVEEEITQGKRQSRFLVVRLKSRKTHASGFGYQPELCIYQKRKTDTKSISAESRNCKQTTPRLIAKGFVLIMTLCLTSYPEFVLSLFHCFQTFFIGWNHRFNDKYIVVSRLFESNLTAHQSVVPAFSNTGIGVRCICKPFYLWC